MKNLWKLVEFLHIVCWHWGKSRGALGSWKSGICGKLGLPAGGGVPQSARLKSAVMLIHNPGKISTSTHDWCISDTAVWPVFL